MMKLGSVISKTEFMKFESYQAENGADKTISMASANFYSLMQVSIPIVIQLLSFTV